MRIFASKTEEYYDAPLEEFPLPIRALFRIVAIAIMAFSKPMWRWRVEDAEKLPGPDAPTGSVIICNHTSMAEVAVVFAFWRMRGRRLRLIMKSEFNRNAFVRWAFARAGAIPVERGTADLKSLRCAQHALQRGEDVFIFPEGTRIRSEEQPVTVHGGFAIMAGMSKAPVVPMAVCGFRDITPDGARLMRPVRCWLRIGDAVEPGDAPAGLRRSARTQWVEDTAVQRMYALRDGLRRAHPGRF